MEKQITAKNLVIFLIAILLLTCFVSAVGVGGGIGVNISVAGDDSQNQSNSSDSSYTENNNSQTSYDSKEDDNSNERNEEISLGFEQDEKKQKITLKSLSITNPDVENAKNKNSFISLIIMTLSSFIALCYFVCLSLFNEKKVLPKH